VRPGALAFHCNPLQKAFDRDVVRWLPSIRKRKYKETHDILAPTPTAPFIRQRTRAGVLPFTLVQPFDLQVPPEEALFDKIEITIGCHVDFPNAADRSEYLSVLADSSGVMNALFTEPQHRGRGVKLIVDRGWHMSGVAKFMPTVGSNTREFFQFKLSINPTRWLNYHCNLALADLQAMAPEFSMRQSPDVRSVDALDGRDNFLSDRSRAASQADRIAANPGQLTTYFTGALEIMRLRHAAEAALGPRFDIRAFHAQVLGDGSVTLPMLRAKVEAWVAATRKPHVN